MIVGAQRPGERIPPGKLSAPVGWPPADRCFFWASNGPRGRGFLAASAGQRGTSRVQGWTLIAI
jgi:hypothetical protein